MRLCKQPVIFITHSLSRSEIFSVSCPFYTDLSDRTLKQTEKKREQQQQQNKYTILFESQYISFYFLAFNQTDLSPSTI